MPALGKMLYKTLPSTRLKNHIIDFFGKKVTEE
jgi:hypothetical protein